MPYAVSLSPRARSDINKFIRYLRNVAGKVIALKYYEALEHDKFTLIANNPKAFPPFHETGAPYRAKLIKLARTTYWIIYTVDDESQTINLLRFWTPRGNREVMGFKKSRELPQSALPHSGIGVCSPRLNRPVFQFPENYLNL